MLLNAWVKTEGELKCKDNVLSFFFERERAREWGNGGGGRGAEVERENLRQAPHLARNPLGGWISRP